MKFSTIATVFALATAASAQLDNIPSCALACFLGPLSEDGCKDLTDFACHCSKGGELLGKVQPCTKEACSDEDQKKAIEAVESTCKAAGVPIEIPDEPAATTTVAASSTPMYTATQTPDTTITVPSTSEFYTATQTPDTTITVSESTTSAAIGTVTGSNSTSAASATPSEFTGAAAHATQAAGLFGAAALALLAF